MQESTPTLSVSGRVLWSVVTNYLQRFLNLGLTILLTPFILDRVGTAQYALWIVAGAVVGYGALFDFGISSTVVKHVAEYRARNQMDEMRQLVATALRLYCIIGLLFLLLTIIAALISPHLFRLSPSQRASFPTLLILLGINVTVSFVGAAPGAVLVGFQRFDLVNMLGAISALMSAGAIVPLLLTGAGITGIVVAGLATNVIAQVTTFWLIHKTAGALHLTWYGASWSRAVAILTFGSPLFLLHLGGTLQSKTDEIVIAIFLPLGFVTPYALALRLSTVAQTMTENFTNVLPPLAAELSVETEGQRLRTMYLTSSRLTLVLFLPIGAVLVMLGGNILTAWVGHTVAARADLVTILTAAILIDMILWPAGAVLQSMGRHQILGWTTLASGLANLALSIVLLKRFGLTGVALGTLIPTSVEAVVLVLPYTLRAVQVGMMEFMMKVALPALIPLPAAAAIIWLSHAAFPLTNIVGIAVVSGVATATYGIVYVLFGASSQERQIYRAAARLAFETVRMGR